MGRLFLGNDNFPIEGVAWIRIPGMGRSGESSRNFWRCSLRGGALLSSGGALQGDVLLSSGGALIGGTCCFLLVVLSPGERTSLFWWIPGVVRLLQRRGLGERMGADGRGRRGWDSGAGRATGWDGTTVWWGWRAMKRRVWGARRRRAEQDCNIALDKAVGKWEFQTPQRNQAGTQKEPGYIANTDQLVVNT